MTNGKVIGMGGEVIGTVEPVDLESTTGPIPTLADVVGAIWNLPEAILRADRAIIQAKQSFQPYANAPDSDALKQQAYLRVSKLMAERHFLVTKLQSAREILPLMDEPEDPEEPAVSWMAEPYGGQATAPTEAPTEES